MHTKIDVYKRQQLYRIILLNCCFFAPRRASAVHRIRPVSYTHLDVYKRQSSPLASDSAVSLLEAGSESASISADVIPVSYTHLEYSRFDKTQALKNAQMYAHDMIGNLNAGMNLFIDWNIALNEELSLIHIFFHSTSS